MMIFTVPENFEGSFVLNTLNQALWKGCHISITGNDLYAPDVKSAIKRGVLIPFEKDEYNEISDISNDAMIINKTSKMLVLGELVLKPWASRLVDKNIADSREVKGAESNGFIAIVSDKESLSEQSIKTVRGRETVVIKDKKNKKVAVKKKSKKTVEIIEPVQREQVEDKTVAQVWDFQGQEAKDAELVNKVSDVIHTDEETDPKPSKKKKTKKTKKKKKANIKKRGKTTKNKNVKPIQPVGDVKEPPDVAIGLDSRGDPLDKPSKTVGALIDKAIEKLSFVDKEQEVKTKEKRGILNDWEWDDL